MVEVLSNFEACIGTCTNFRSIGIGTNFLTKHRHYQCNPLIPIQQQSTIYSLILNSFSTSPNCRPNVTIHTQHRHPSNRAILGSPGHSLNHMIWYTVPSLGCTYIIDGFNGFREPTSYGTLYVFLKSYHMVHCNNSMWPGRSRGSRKSQNLWRRCRSAGLRPA